MLEIDFTSRKKSIFSNGQNIDKGWGRGREAEGGGELRAFTSCRGGAGENTGGYQKIDIERGSC